MMIIRSATASTSASMCEESSTVPPRSATPRSSARDPDYDALVATVKARGILQPIRVRDIPPATTS